MKYFRNHNSVYDLEKEISLFKSKVVRTINEYCNNFYDNEMVDSNKVEEKRKNLLNNSDIKYGFQERDSLYSNKNDFYIRATCGEIDIKEERRYGKLIKQADTIEELCDEFVLVNLEYFGQVNPKHYDTLYELETKNSFEQEGGMSLAIKGGWYAIYGAIWTDKGLIFVAKMNEKGELELL